MAVPLPGDAPETVPTFCTVHEKNVSETEDDSATLVLCPEQIVSPDAETTGSGFTVAMTLRISPAQLFASGVTAYVTL